MYRTAPPVKLKQCDVLHLNNVLEENTNSHPPAPAASSPGAEALCSEREKALLASQSLLKSGLFQVTDVTHSVCFALLLLCCCGQRI